MDVADVAVRHVADQLALVGRPDHARGDERAVAQDDNALAELEHLLQAMADVDDGDTLVAQPSDQMKSCRLSCLVR